MYCRLPYVSRGALPLKTLVLYIYRPRGTMQYNQQSYAIYSSDKNTSGNCFFITKLGKSHGKNAKIEIQWSEHN
jgi:hypothetical protein